MGSRWMRVARPVVLAGVLPLACGVLAGGCPQAQVPRPSPVEQDPNDTTIQDPTLDDSPFVVPQDRPVTIPDPIDEPILLP